MTAAKANRIIIIQEETQMSHFVVTTESSCDLPLAYCQAHDIRILYMRYEMDGVGHVETMREEDLHTFYETMAKGAKTATSAANMDDYYRFWKPMAELGQAIVHIALGTGVSCSYQNAMLAKEQLLAEYPALDLRIVDSLGASLVYGIQAIKAAELRDAGMSAAECEEFLLEYRHHISPYYTTSNLEYLYRGGRVSRAGMVIAHTLNIWPILNLNDKGQLKVVDKCRGREKTYRKIHSHIAEYCENPTEQTLYIAHAHAPEEAKAFAEGIRAEFGFKDIFYSNIGTAIGAHTGPGLVAAFFYGKSRKANEHS